jgi:hypothetical protein
VRGDQPPGPVSAATKPIGLKQRTHWRSVASRTPAFWALARTGSQHPGRRAMGARVTVDSEGAINRTKRLDSLPPLP